MGNRSAEIYLLLNVRWQSVLRYYERRDVTLKLKRLFDSKQMRIIDLAFAEGAKFKAIACDLIAWARKICIHIQFHYKIKHMIWFPISADIPMNNKSHKCVLQRDKVPLLENFTQARISHKLFTPSIHRSIGSSFLQVCIAHFQLNPLARHPTTLSYILRIMPRSHDRATKPKRGPSPPIKTTPTPFRFRLPVRPDPRQ